MRTTIFGAAWLLLAASPAMAVPATSTTGAPAARTPLEALGTVRADTLYVTLDKVRAAALQHNEMLAASVAAADAAADQALGAWQGLLPQIQVGEVYLRSDDALNAFAFKLNQRSVTAADFDPAALNAPPIAENHISRLELRQPLFNGGMGWYGKRAADAMASAAAYDRHRAAETVDLQAVEAYDGLVLAGSYERVVNEAISAAQAHLAQAQARVDAEMATEADLLQARVQLGGLRQRLIEVRNMAAAAGQNILLLTAAATDLPLAAEADFSDPGQAPAGQAAPAPAATAPAESLAAASAAALPPAPAARADVRAARLRADAAGRMVGVARGALLPHLNLGLERDWYGDRFFSGSAKSWTLGVFATWDLFSGLRDLGRLRQARAEKRAADYAYEFGLRRAHVEATQSRLDLRAADEKVRVAREAVAAGREAARIVTAQYGEGLASMTDLLDTQAAATAAEGNLVQALHDYNVGLARLRYADGASRAEEE